MDQKEHCRAPRKDNSQSGFVAYMHHTYTVFVSPDGVCNLLQVGWIKFVMWEKSHVWKYVFIPWVPYPIRRYDNSCSTIILITLTLMHTCQTHNCLTVTTVLYSAIDIWLIVSQSCQCQLNDLFRHKLTCVCPPLQSFRKRRTNWLALPHTVCVTW